ncbi:MAG: hypothetical protein ACPGED_08655, partial [Flavobacteriales bacterium]
MLMRYSVLLFMFFFTTMHLHAQDCENDFTAPVFSSQPADQSILCTEQIGEQEILTATDDCDEEVDVFATSTVVESNEVCQFTNTSWPNSDQPAAFKIFLNNNESIFMELVDILYNETNEIDGSSNVLMTGTFKEHNAEGGFVFTLRLEEGMTWDQW